MANFLGLGFRVTRTRDAVVRAHAVRALTLYARFGGAQPSVRFRNENEKIFCVAHIHRSRPVATLPLIRKSTNKPPSATVQRDRPTARSLRPRAAVGTGNARASRRRPTTSDVERPRDRASVRTVGVRRSWSRARRKRARDFDFNFDLDSRLNTHRHRPRPRGRRGTRGDARSIGAWRGRRRDDALSPDVGETSTRWMGAGREAREMGARTGVGRRGDDGDARGERGRGESAAAAEDRLLGRLDECVVLCEAVRTRRVHAAVSSVH